MGDHLYDNVVVGRLLLSVTRLGCWPLLLCRPSLAWLDGISVIVRDSLEGYMSDRMIDSCCFCVLSKHPVSCTGLDLKKVKHHVCPDRSGAAKDCPLNRDDSKALSLSRRYRQSLHETGVVAGARICILVTTHVEYGGEPLRDSRFPRTLSDGDTEYPPKSLRTAPE